MCQGGVLSLRKKLLDTFGAQVFSDHERYPADVKCLSLLYLYVGRYPRNNASRNSSEGKRGGTRPYRYPSFMRSLYFKGQTDTSRWFAFEHLLADSPKKHGDPTDVLRSYPKTWVTIWDKGVQDKR